MMGWSGILPLSKHEPVHIWTASPLHRRLGEANNFCLHSHCSIMASFPLLWKSVFCQYCFVLQLKDTSASRKVSPAKMFFSNLCISVWHHAKKGFWCVTLFHRSQGIMSSWRHVLFLSVFVDSNWNLRSLIWPSINSTFTWLCVVHRQIWTFALLFSYLFRTEYEIMLVFWKIKTISAQTCNKAAKHTLSKTFQ